MRTLLLAALLVIGSSLDLSGQSAPYGIDRRPQPRGSLVDSLLPRSVGQFRRAPFAPGTPVPVNEPLTVSYGAGPDSVVLAFRIPGAPDEAQAAVRRSRDDVMARHGDVRGAVYVERSDPSFYHSDRVMAWSRAGYFFDARASSAAALDRFMQAFPF
jgi:hypothetical protein